jgi:hypothetical protein
MLILLERALLSVAVALVIAVAGHFAIAATMGIAGSRWPLEVLRDPRPSFTGEARRALLLAPRLAEAKRPVILVVGASNAQEGFRPAHVSRLAPEYDSANLAIAAANMTEVEQIVRSAIRWTPPEVRKQSVIVLSLTYPMFSPDSVRWFNQTFVPASDIAAGKPRTDIDRAFERCTFLSALHEISGTDAPRPFEHLLAEHYSGYQSVSEHLPKGLVEGSLPAKRLWSYNVVRRLYGSPSPPKKAAKDQLDFIADLYFGGARQGVSYDEQLGKLRRIIGLASSAGMRTVVVNMPLTSWHVRGMPASSEFNARLRLLMESPDIAGSAQYLDMERMAGDDEFRDSVHPKPSRGIEWARLLVSWLQGRPQPDPAQAAPVKEISDAR